MGFPGKNTGVGSHSLLQGNLPNPGTEPGSPALQADSLPSKPPGVSTLMGWPSRWPPGPALPKASLEFQHFLLAAGLRSSLAGPSTGILITWQLALPWVSDPRGSKKTTRPEAAVSHNLTSEAASHPLFCVMFVPQTKLGATCEWTTQEYRREPGSHNRTNTYKPYLNTYFYLTRWVYF